jgi:hypothetical protein
MPSMEGGLMLRECLAYSASKEPIGSQAVRLQLLSKVSRFNLQQGFFICWRALIVF